MDGKTVPQTLDDRNQCLHIRCVSRPHLAANRLAVIVQNDPNHHLVQIGTVILAVPQFADRLPAFSFKIDRGGVKKNTIQTAEKIPACPE